MKLRCYKYQLPFKKPFVTAAETYAYRQGIIFKLEKDGIQCWADAAPLPEFSKIKLNELIQQLADNWMAICEQLEEPWSAELFDHFYEINTLAPCLQFALDTLGATHQALQQKTSLADFLSESHAASSLSLNAIIGSGKPERVINLANQQIAQGFGTLKLKLGSSFDKTKMILSKIRRLHPTVNLRLDANQSWTFKQAVNNLRQIEGLDIEYCEEPLKSSEVNQLGRLYAETDVPLALDETLYQTQNWQNLLQFTAALVIKPMISGSFSKIFVTNKLADYHNNRTILTSSLESGIGRSITAALAKIISSNNTHGLSTGMLFATDVYDDQNCIRHGQYFLSENLLLSNKEKATINYTILKEIIF